MTSGERNDQVIKVTDAVKAEWNARLWDDLHAERERSHRLRRDLDDALARAKAAEAALSKFAEVCRLAAAIAAHEMGE